jgi:hypothetical protein
MMALMAGPWTVDAQGSIDDRSVLFATVGRASTLDDEGSLGTGTALSAGAGLRLTPRLALHLVVDRIPYHREAEHLVFDGRVLFAGVEAAFGWSAGRVRPFVTVGAGLMHDRKRWTHRSLAGPGRMRVDEVTEHAYTLTTARASGGIEVPLSEGLSVRAGVTVHGLLDTGDDLAAHVILQPMAGVAWRW